MVKRLIKHLWESRVELGKYFTIGVSGFVFDIVSLYVFKVHVHLSPTVAVVITQLFVVTYIFLLNKYWAFKARGITHQQFIRFLSLFFANYCLAVVWMWFFTEFWQVHIISPDKDYLLVRTANIVLSVAWNFLLYKHWVYKTPTPPAALQQ